MSLPLAILSPHVPRICHEEQTPEFQKELVQGMHQARAVLEQVKPDVVVLFSTHWFTTFNHYVDATPVHKGKLTADECPDMIASVPYHYQGDPELAEQLVEAGKEAGIPVVGFSDENYVLDYGTVVPLRYLVPNEDIPLVELSICGASNLEESYRWGQQIGKALRESAKKAVFISSGALSHNVVRGPEKMPTLTEQALDKQFTQYMMKGESSSAWQMLPQYARTAGVEGGGRHLATLLGVLGQDQYQASYWGYGQSSGSANAVITFSLEQ